MAKPSGKSSFPLRFPPIGRAGKARRAEGGGGGDSARRPARRSFNAGGAQPVPFGYFQTNTAKLHKIRSLNSMKREGL